MNESNSRFENLEVWKISMQLCVNVYKLMENIRDYSFKDQVQRAAVSIPANIAEGMERQTNKETVHFLYIAKGSAGECRTLLYLAVKLNYISKEQGMEIVERLKKISAMLYGLIATRKKPITRALLNIFTFLPLSPCSI